MTKTIRCIIAAVNANGESDFYFVKVRASQEQYENGDHLDRAEEAAGENDYEPKLVFDEFDAAGKAILGHFDWETSSTVTVGDEGDGFQGNVLVSILAQ